MDLILTVVQLLKEDINRLVVEAWEALELVKLQDKGQLSYIIGHVTVLVYRIYGIYKKRYILNIPRVPYILSISQAQFIYLKDHSPYLDSSSFYSKSQNIIRVNLLGNHSTNYYYVINFLFTYIPSLLVSLPQYFL